MNTDALLTVVAEWLEESEIPPLVPRRRPGIDLEGLKRILAIVGPRRAGKTYYMYQLAGSLLATGRHTRRDILFVDFEDYRLSGFSGEHVDALLAAFQQLAGRAPRFLFLDEVQIVPEWSRILRTLHNRRRFGIVVSGSSSKLLHREVATELRGRTEDVLMLPFSFPEYLIHEGLEPSRATLHTAARGRIAAAFEAYLEHGGYPEVVLAGSAPERRRLLQSYFRTIVYRDVLERHGIRARHLLDALMGEFLETYACLFSISRFEKSLKANGLPGSKRTIANYLHHLRDAFFVIANEKFSFSPRRRLMNPKKVYLMDTGFAALGRSFSENRGRALENLVAVELFRREEDVFYFKGRNECDFVIQRGRGPVEAIQVCGELTRRNEKCEQAGLAEACRTLEVDSGMILTFSQEDRILVDDREVLVRPVWRWLLETDPAGGLGKR